MRVAHDELLSIGRFAQLAGLTAKALRHYDELGLLRPAYVDDFTGYRWYSLEQVRDAVAIRRLRAFELPLDEIAEVLRGGDALLRERLTVQRARLQGRAVVTERMIDELDRLLRGEEELVPARSLGYRVRDVPELVLAAIHRPARLGELPIPELIGETGKWAFAHDRVPGAPVAICPAWSICGSAGRCAGRSNLPRRSSSSCVRPVAPSYIPSSATSWGSRMSGGSSGSRYRRTGSVRAARRGALRNEP